MVVMSDIAGGEDELFAWDALPPQHGEQEREVAHDNHFVCTACGATWHKDVLAEQGMCKGCWEDRITMHKLEDLVAAVREIPPSTIHVTKKFADLCFEVANDSLELTDEQVIEIVTNWPHGCDNGRSKYLRSVGISQGSNQVNATFLPCVTMTHEGIVSVDFGSSLDSAWADDGNQVNTDEADYLAKILDGVMNPRSAVTVWTVLQQAKALHRLANYMEHHLPEAERTYKNGTW